VCREISQAAPSLPIIILSAKTEVMDKVLLLELGAHDYVTKPFSPRELLARVRTAMRRSTRTPLTETFKFGDVKIDFTKMELWRDGAPGAADFAGIQSAEVHDPERGASAIAGGIAEPRLGV
jgi:two-component system, OmpR family, alkaline phosphatase synthesis response regulator PhoP